MLTDVHGEIGDALRVFRVVTQWPGAQGPADLVEDARAYVGHHRPYSRRPYDRALSAVQRGGVDGVGRRDQRAHGAVKGRVDGAQVSGRQLIRFSATRGLHQRVGHAPSTTEPARGDSYAAVQEARAAQIGVHLAHRQGRHPGETRVG
ncbi:hypothetical protein [Streptomyces sp. NPDC055954]|uniref:hypothetical protein n=1 Tax=Streptomyces sp. NPDC055954 TaxID=3345664 RepID=UPI0035DCDD06